MLVLKRRPGESLVLFETATGNRLLDITYSGWTDDGIIVDTVKPDGERHAFEMERGRVINIKDQIGRDLIVIQYNYQRGRRNQAAFCIFGARKEVTVLRGEIAGRKDKQ